MMNRNAVLFLMGVGALGLAACGRKHDEAKAGAPVQTRTGAYAVGDRVKYRVDREGYALAQFLTEGSVTKVDGPDATVEWRDVYSDSLALIEWDGAKNPTIDVRSYAAALTASPTKVSCDYEPETVGSVDTALGAIPCVTYSRTCKETDKTYRISGCQSAQIAITRDVAYSKEYLDDKGAVLRKFTWTLLENVKN